jgi:hypothetical protein
MGMATPPTSYGGYGGNANEKPKYTFEYPAGWKSEVPSKVCADTQQQRQQAQPSNAPCCVLACPVLQLQEVTVCSCCVQISITTSKRRMVRYTGTYVGQSREGTHMFVAPFLHVLVAPCHLSVLVV